MMFLHSILFSMSFFLAPTSSIFSFTTSRNLYFGLPLFLFPGNFISITLLHTYSWSLLITRPYQLSLPSLIFNTNRSTFSGNFLSPITPDTFFYPFHPASTLLFTSLSQLPLSCTVDPKYLNSFTLDTFVSSIFTVSLSFPPFTHKYSVLDLLNFISLLSNAYLQHSNLRSTSFLVSSQITISSANSIVHNGSLLTSSISRFIITANRNGLNADPWCSRP